MAKSHSFHIPVMGIGFTADTPIKVAQYGIDSVISIVDDILLEKLRKVYCEKLEIPYHEITDKIKDFRAERVKSYLNLVNKITKDKFEELKNTATEKSNDFRKYLSLLPDGSAIKQKFNELKKEYFDFSEITTRIKNNLSIGSIDVNIMTKLDKKNYANGEALPDEFNDAHAALRGYANSNLSSSIVLSAGMNPRLYSYFEGFEDFYPNEEGEIKKKIVLKVSDYRSALIQGKFFAKKGLWVSEYRIESGLNCGGHAFATDGFLMGPILNEFKEHRDCLIDAAHEILVKALKEKGKIVPKEKLPVKVTAQGGVGTAEEHDFLVEHYGLDSIGWGSPFLLVPEATTVDTKTLDLLAKAQEEDLYLSNISPLGVPFNSLRGNTKDVEKLALVDAGKPGSLCPKKYLVSNTDYTEKALCTASRRFQKIKIKELDEQNLSDSEYNKEYDKIVDKSCICVGLGTASLLEYNVDTKLEGTGVSVCPGPNMAYFSKKMSLKELIDHIYGRASVSEQNRPNVFMKEMKIYLDFLKDKVAETKTELTRKQKKYFTNFVKNMNSGISYYQNLFSEKHLFNNSKNRILSDLEKGQKALDKLNSKIEELSKVPELV